MMLHKVCAKLCRLCGKEKQQGTEVFDDKVKGAVLISIINKYLSKEVINILASDVFSKYVCIECEQKICIFDEFCMMVANVQKQLTAPSLELDFAEDMLCHLKGDIIEKSSMSSPMDKRKCICDVCSKSFRCQAHLDRHKRVHTGIRPFVCDICRMSFNQREILVKHKERHEGKKQFQCANCHQAFRYKVSLRSHLITFHSEADTSTLTAHVSPTPNRSLTCTDCGKMFATKYKLQRHSRCHSGERPFRCTYCDRSFSQTGNLKMHQAKCHRLPCVIAEAEHMTHTDPNAERDMAGPLNNFETMFITESEIQKTINETINSTDPGTSYLSKTYENPIYIDDEIETMLDQDLGQLERSKYSSAQEKVSLCLKQPETPELLHSLLYDD